MAILNYTTSVPVERTVGEITSRLVRKGARSITSEFREDGSVQAVSFIMFVGGFPVRFLLPANASGVAAVMLKDSPYTFRKKGSRIDYEAAVRKQAEKTAWRILKDWVEAQMALIESGQAEPAQVFLPYARHDNGMTMYELFVETNQKRLNAGQ